MSGQQLNESDSMAAAVFVLDTIRAASREDAWEIFMGSLVAAIEQAQAQNGAERGVLAKVRPMLAKLADDANWQEVTWFVDREACVGFVFTGENEQGQTCDANEYAKDILAAVDAGLFSPSSDVQP